MTLIGCPEHSDKKYKSYGGWYVHNKKFHGGKLKAVKLNSGSEPTSKESSPPPVTAESDTAPAQDAKEAFYPSLADWRASPEAEEAPRPEGEAPPPSAPPPSPEPAAIDTAGIWLAAGEFIDNSLLKDKKGKIAMDERKAKLLDKSLQQMGLGVEAPPQPIVLAYWMPFAFTIFSVFVFPILAAYAPDILKRVPFIGKKEKPPMGEADG